MQEKEEIIKNNFYNPGRIDVNGYIESYEDYKKRRYLVRVAKKYYLKGKRK